MINTGDLKRGITIELENHLWTVLEFNHIKIGRGSAQVRLKLRNLRSGSTVEKTFQSGERFMRATLDHRNVQFLYEGDGLYNFMDTDTFDQIALNESQVGHAKHYLKDGSTAELLQHEDEPLAIELPPNVVLQVTYTEPGYRGDTATGGNKPATVETGLVIQVPLFVKTDDMIKVDTRTDTYIERV